MPAIILAMLSEALLDHFRNPRNAGELPEATARIEVSNPVCGDVLRLAAVFEDGVVREVGFLCRGCTASIACASLLTESMRGRELRGLRKITAESLSEALGGLPEASFHAAQLARQALEALLEAVGK
jgi:nitrogen fixation NifU-like protein